MSLGRTKEEQELNARLVQGLVMKEVLEPMSAIGWGHGTPPSPEQIAAAKAANPGNSGQPAPAEGASGPAAAPAARPVSGQPVPPVAAKPAPTDAPKADTPDAAFLDKLFEPLRDANGLISGKYKSGVDAFKGAGHLANMAKQAFSERDALLKRVAELEARGVAAPAASPAATPVAKPVVAPSRERYDKASANLDAVLSGIHENGGILDKEMGQKLSAAQREVADAAAEFRVMEDRALRKQEEESAKAAQAEWSSVDRYMNEKYPAAAQFSEEAALYMQSDPLLAAAVNALLAQGKKLEATELAWTSFAKVHGDQVAAADRAKAEDREADLAAREQVRNEKVAEARKDAGVVTGSSGGAGVHERANLAGGLEEIEAAREQMRREGDSPGSPAAMRFRSLVIGPSLDPAYFPRQ